MTLIFVGKGPGATVDVVRRLVISAKSKASESIGQGAEVGNVNQIAKEQYSGSEPATALDAETSDKAKADVAAEVADSAEKLDGNIQG